jgi:hypothetical protein
MSHLVKAFMWGLLAVASLGLLCAICGWEVFGLPMPLGSFMIHAAVLVVLMTWSVCGLKARVDKQECDLDVIDTFVDDLQIRVAALETKENHDIQ